MRNLSPFYNKFCIAVLTAVLLGGCTGSMVKPDAGSTPQAATKLPRAYEQALGLMRTGDYPAAIPALQAFIEEQPELAGPRVNLGIAFRQTGQHDKALQALHEAVRLNPDSATAHHQLGIEYREQGRFESAQQAYQQALTLDADYALAHRNIGILYDLYLQQPVLALDHYRSYLELETEPDKTVNRWVVDLERRTASAQASAKP